MVISVSENNRVVSCLSYRRFQQTSNDSESWSNKDRIVIQICDRNLTFLDMPVNYSHHSLQSSLQLPYPLPILEDIATETTMYLYDKENYAFFTLH